MGKKKPKRQKPEPAATDQPLIFLDIDGVLAPFGGRAPPGPPTQRSAKLDADAAFAPFDEQCTQRLAAIVEATGAAIVLSSSWRARADAVAVLKSSAPSGRRFLKNPAADDGHKLQACASGDRALPRGQPRDEVALDDGCLWGRCASATRLSIASQRSPAVGLQGARGRGDSCTCER